MSVAVDNLRAGAHSMPVPEFHVPKGSIQARRHHRAEITAVANCLDDHTRARLRQVAAAGGDIKALPMYKLAERKEALAASVIRQGLTGWVQSEAGQAWTTSRAALVAQAADSEEDEEEVEVP